MIVLQKYSEVFDFQSKNIKNINLILLSTLISGNDCPHMDLPAAIHSPGHCQRQDGVGPAILTILLLEEHVLVYPPA